jgi:hypothetical protein
VLMSIAKEPAKRFQSADAMARALRALSSQQPRPIPTASGSGVKQDRLVIERRPDVPRRVDPQPRRAAVAAPLPAQISQPAQAPGVLSRLAHSRISWVAGGAGAVLLTCAVALRVPGLLAGASANGDREISAVQPTAADVLPENELASEHRELVQLRSRADSDYARLARHPLTGAAGDRSSLDRQYDRIRAHLRSAENDLTSRDSTSARQELDTAQKEIAALESNFSQ